MPSEEVDEVVDVNEENEGISCFSVGVRDRSEKLCDSVDKDILALFCKLGPKSNNQMEELDLMKVNQLKREARVVLRIYESQLTTTIVGKRGGNWCCCFARFRPIQFWLVVVLFLLLVVVAKLDDKPMSKLPNFEFA